MARTTPTTYGGGTLVALPYDEWARLDDELAPHRRRAYEAAAPVFYADYAVSEIDLAQAFKSFCLRGEQLQIAFILSTAAPLPMPSSSIAYMQSAEGMHRLIGPRERQAMLDSHTHLLIESGVLEKARPVLDLITRGQNALVVGEIQEAITALADGGLRNFQPIDGIVRCGIALESLLMADVTKGVTKVFIQRGAALLACTPEDVGKLQEDLATVYSLRSDALHGRDWMKNLTSSFSEQKWYSWLRQCLACAVCRIVYLIVNSNQSKTALDAFRRQLDSAGSSKVPLPGVLNAPGPSLS